MQKFRNNVIWTTVLTALAGVCLGLLSLYFAAAGSGAMCRFYLKDPLLAALNVLPFVLFALLLFGLTGRAWLAFLLDGVVCLVYSWAAYWKWLGGANRSTQTTLRPSARQCRSAGAGTSR